MDMAQKRDETRLDFAKKEPHSLATMLGISSIDISSTLFGLINFRELELLQPMSQWPFSIGGFDGQKC